MGLSADQLRQILELTLSPHKEQRKAAEQQLEEAQRAVGHAMVVLQLVQDESGTLNPSVRQAAAVHFKNLIKNGWVADAVETDSQGRFNVALTDLDREQIKQHLVELMCRVPPSIQAQCSASVAIIAQTDYHLQWQGLLPDLISRLTNPASNMTVINGCLSTANTIFASFVNVGRSEALYAKIIYTLQLLQQPIFQLYQHHLEAIKNKVDGNNKEALKERLEALRLMTCICYSLNHQDLPEYFEDNIVAFLDILKTLLSYSNPLLEDADEDDQPSIVTQLQSAVVQILALYANKDEECFIDHLPAFTTMIWNLLQTTITPQPKFDQLASSCMKFLASQVSKSMHRRVFEGGNALEPMVALIVIPNLQWRTSDEEQLEDDPTEFMATDLEGSDTDSRRKCALVLLKSMCRLFAPQTAGIVLQHVQRLLSEYESSGPQNARIKEVAIQLWAGVAVELESGLGVSQMRGEAGDFGSFFVKTVFPELEKPATTGNALLSASAISFVARFRNQFTTEHMVSLLPMLIQHLQSPIIVVHTYAAYAIEKLLTNRQGDGAKLSLSAAIYGKLTPHKLSREAIHPFLDKLFQGLFNIVGNTTWDENAYVMKSVMRALARLGDGVGPVTEQVLARLTEALHRVAKNPRNPLYNHYLFESIAVLIKFTCQGNAALVPQFEELLFPHFQTILQMDVAEFTPYVYQLMAQLLEFRPDGLGPGYQGMLEMLVLPQVWENSGNIPALVRLLCAYLRRPEPEANQFCQRFLNPILGIFQKLVASKRNEMDGMQLLSTLTANMGPTAMTLQLYSTVFDILLARLQAPRCGDRFKRLVVVYWSLWVGKLGATEWISLLERKQVGLSTNIMQFIWLKRLEESETSLGWLLNKRKDLKVAVIGLARMIPETINMAPNTTLSRALTVLMTLLGGMNAGALATVTTGTTAADLDFEEDDQVEIVSDSTFNLLHFARRPAPDLFPDVPNVLQYVATTALQPVTQRAGGQGWVAGVTDPKAKAQLQQLLSMSS